MTRVYVFTCKAAYYVLYVTEFEPSVQVALYLARSLATAFMLACLVAIMSTALDPQFYHRSQQLQS
jgi:hypothetical protein